MIGHPFIDKSTEVLSVIPKNKFRNVFLFHSVWGNNRLPYSLMPLQYFEHTIIEIQHWGVLEDSYYRISYA